MRGIVHNCTTTVKQCDFDHFQELLFGCYRGLIVFRCCTRAVVAMLTLFLSWMIQTSSSRERGKSRKSKTVYFAVVKKQVS